ncbi:cation:proton antiporter domain-containing protein [Halobacterium noricense]|uniref:cation:proton antiporter domain-containing protein n=1 Tax=Halobacterium noricense TaxID=223182 RepID=UPI001E501294|nr:cation:proton antiporter [Halobacterium noricense]UHH25006.1 cation:proton antiporter [Halobacterium noricense]
MSSELIPLVATIIALGVASQVIADRLQVPSVLFLVIAGILVGPEVLGVVTLETFGGAETLSGIVGLSVAIIVFEGAFHLKLPKLREAPGAVVRLTTVGAAISLVGTALSVHYLLGANWDMSFLVGSLLVATGPTVITPILDIVPVRNRVAAALETEGVVNDVTAAILAIVVFEVVKNPELTRMQIIEEFTVRLGIGVLFGLVVAGIVWYLLRHVDLSRGNAPQNARLIVLASALVAYGAADILRGEAGIAAVATAGMVLGNADLPYEEEIEAFKGDVTLVVLSFVFIGLAALLSFDNLIKLGVGGLAVVALVALVIRPLGVFLSTRGERYTLSERTFMSVVGPRGIIPASVATLFAVQLQSNGMEEAASLLVGVVFLVILLTVVFEGGFARHIAQALEVIPMRVIIVGGGTVGRALGERLEDRGENVVLIEKDVEMVERTRNEGFTVHHGDGTDTDELRAAGAENARIVVAATGDDDANLLVSQLADSKFDVDTIIARANNPDNVDAFEDLGVRTVSSSLATAWGIDNIIERPALANWMTEIGRSGDVQEVEVTSEDLVGKTIDELDAELPNGCIIALVGRDDENQVPSGDFTLQQGDHLTFLGRKEAVREALNWCHPHD